MARPRGKPEEKAEPKVKPSSCPRAWSHRVGSFCKTCGRTT